MTVPRIVLLSNDDAPLAAMHALLINEGYRTLRCRPRDVTDAHAVVKRTGADLVILDLWLAKREDGWAFLARMCADLATAHIPAIIASGQGEMLPRQAEMLQAMRCHVLVKPFDAQELLRVIEAALGPSSAHAAPHADPLIAAVPDYPLAATGETI